MTSLVSLKNYFCIGILVLLAAENSSAAEPGVYVRGIGTGEMSSYMGQEGTRTTGSFSSVQAGGALPTFRMTANNMAEVYRDAGGYSEAAQYFERGMPSYRHPFQSPVDKMYAVFPDGTQKTGPYTGTAWPGWRVHNLAPSSQPVGLTIMTKNPNFEGSYSLPRNLNPNIGNPAANAGACTSYGPNHTAALSYGLVALPSGYMSLELTKSAFDSSLSPPDRAVSAGGALTVGSGAVALGTMAAWEYAGPATMLYAPKYFPVAQQGSHLLVKVGMGGMQLGGAVAIGAGLGTAGRAVDRYTLGNRASATVGAGYMAIYDTLAIPYHLYLGQRLYDNTRTSGQMIWRGGQDIGW